MKQSVFNLNSLKAHPERNAFDLSHNDVFSCAPGMLLPISCTEVLPNEHYEINPQIFLRTMPLNSAAFVRLRQHVEFFFVPMRVLSRQFQQFVVGTKYPQSALSTLNEFSGTLPSITLANMRYWLKNVPGLDGLNIALSYGAKRLFDLLGYGFCSVRAVDEDNYPDSYTLGSTTQSSPSLSLFRLAAYQKIYQDFYRNAYWEPADAETFNLDDKFGVPFNPSQTADMSRLTKLFTIRYRNWSKDFFTSVQPSFQGAPFVTRNVDMSNFILDAAGSRTVSPQTYQMSNHGSLPDTSTFSGSTLTGSLGSSGTLSLPIHNIRAAFALDKLYRLQQQSGNGSYGEQIRNRFGFGGVHDDWKATYLGGSSSPISIGEVITTANTIDPSVTDEPYGMTGDIYGKASSVNDAKFTFDTKEHGIIMGIFSVSPDADYNSFGIDPHNFKLNFEQFYQPEFDRLGHQPINTYYLTCLSSASHINSKSWLQRVIGFQNRYLEYKTGIDKVHGQFCTGGSLSAWTAPRNTGLLFDVSGTAFNYNSLKVHPKIMNSICSVSFDGSDKTDPILVDSHISIKAIRPMSVSDEPLL
ncbi:major capsid protein [Microvirus sp.]|nr:major capsid protein [Microvirus sp.]